MLGSEWFWVRCHDRACPARILSYRQNVTTEQIIGFSIALLIMLIGFAGNVVPGLPGTPLILIGAIAHRIYFGDLSVNTLVLVLLILLAVLAFALDYVSSLVGAKKFGATWRGVLGAGIGGLVGLFFSIPGIIIGPFVGAMLLEMAGGQEFKPAAKAGAGAMLGLLVGAVGKISISVAMIGLFAVNTLYRSLK